MKSKLGRILIVYSALQWKYQVDQHLAEEEGEASIPMVLAVNKYDLIEDYEKSGAEIDDFMTQEFLDEFAEKNGFEKAIRTSAKTSFNVTNVFSSLVHEILKSNDVQKEEDVMEMGRSTSIMLSYKKSFAGAEKKKKCC